MSTISQIWNPSIAPNPRLIRAKELLLQFDFFTPNKSIVDLRVQKYKNIIDTMVQQQKETEFKKAYQEETGDSLEDDGLEELELYLGQTYGFS